MAARERIAMLRDKAAAVFDKQLDNGEVAPPTAMAAVRDYTKTISDMEQHEANAESGSALDTFLDWLKAER